MAKFADLTQSKLRALSKAKRSKIALAFDNTRLHLGDALNLPTRSERQVIRDRAKFRYDNRAVITPTPIASAMDAPVNPTRDRIPYVPPGQLNDGMGIEAYDDPAVLRQRDDDVVSFIAPERKSYGAYLDPNKPERKRAARVVTWRPADNGPGFFYIGKNKSVYVDTSQKKSGVCTNADQRLTDHNCAVDFEFDVLIPISHKRDVENRFKHDFRDCRIGDTEKFFLPPALDACVEMWVEQIAEEFCPTSLQLENFIS